MEAEDDENLLELSVPPVHYEGYLKDLSQVMKGNQLKAFDELLDKMEGNRKEIPFYELLCHCVFEKSFAWICSQRGLDAFEIGMRLLCGFDMCYDCVGTKEVLEKECEHFIELCLSVVKEENNTSYVLQKMIDSKIFTCSVILPTNGFVIGKVCLEILRKQDDLNLEMIETLFETKKFQSAVIHDARLYDFLCQNTTKEKIIKRLIHATSRFDNLEDLFSIIQKQQQQQQQDDFKEELFPSKISPYIEVYLNKSLNENSKLLARWISNAMSPSAKQEERALALSIVFCALKENTKYTYLIQELFFSSSGFFKLIQNILLQNNFLGEKLPQKVVKRIQIFVDQIQDENNNNNNDSDDDDYSDDVEFDDDDDLHLLDDDDDHDHHDHENIKGLKKQGDTFVIILPAFERSEIDYSESLLQMKSKNDEDKIWKCSDHEKFIQLAEAFENDDTTNNDLFSDDNHNFDAFLEQSDMNADVAIENGEAPVLTFSCANETIKQVTLDKLIRGKTISLGENLDTSKLSVNSNVNGVNTIVVLGKDEKCLKAFARKAFLEQVFIKTEQQNIIWNIFLSLSDFLSTRAGKTVEEERGSLVTRLTGLLGKGLQLLKQGEETESSHYLYRISFTLARFEDPSTSILRDLYDRFLDNLWMDRLQPTPNDGSTNVTINPFDLKKICESFNQWSPHINRNIIEGAIKASTILQPSNGIKQNRLLSLKLCSAYYFGTPFQEDTRLADFDDEICNLMWINLFPQRHEFLCSNPNNEEICQNLLNILIKFCFSEQQQEQEEKEHEKEEKEGPRYQNFALGTIHHLLLNKFTRYHRFIGKNLDKFLKLTFTKTTTPTVRMICLSIIEICLRRQPRTYDLSSTNFKSLCNPEKYPYEKSNHWITSILNSICWSLVQGNKDKVETLESSFIWKTFIKQYEDGDMPIVYKTRATKNSLKQYNYWTTSSNVSCEHLFENDLAFCQLGLLCEDKEVAQVVISKNCANANILFMMYISIFDDLPLDDFKSNFIRKKLQDDDDDEDASIKILLLEFFGASQKSIIIKSLVQQYLPILIDGLQSEMQREDFDANDWLLDLVADLIPLAGAKHLQTKVDNNKNNVLSRLIHILYDNCPEEKKKRNFTLNLMGGGINGTDLLYIQNTIEECKDFKFTSINLSKNELGDEGAIAISTWLCDNNTTILDLNLSRNSIGALGVKHLADSLRRNKTLQSLNLSGNQITDDGENTTSLIALAETLVWNTTLKSLDLSCNVLTQDGVLNVTKALRYNGSLTYLNLQNTCATNIQLTAVADKLQLNRDGITVSPHVKNANRKKIGTINQLEREKTKRTNRLLSGSSAKFSVSPPQPPNESNRHSILEQFVFGATSTSKGNDHQHPELEENKDDDIEERQKSSSALEMEIKQLHESIVALKNKEMQLLYNKNKD